MPTHFFQKTRYLSWRKIPKADGRVRKILVPHGDLREVQDAALLYLTSRDPDTGKYPFFLPPAQTAFKRGASAYANAKKHDGYAMSIKFDIKDFFDSVPATVKRSRRIQNFFRRRLNGKYSVRRKGQVVRTGQRRCGYRIVAHTVVGCLIKEGVPPDIATYIADISSYRGYLYQGSPLSPLLANLVTKHCLVPRMQRLASVYDLPIYRVRDGYVVIAMDGKKLWYYGLDPQGPELKLLRILMDHGHPMGTANYVWQQGPPVQWGTHTEFVEMVQATPGESMRDMTIRYGQQAWVHRMPKAVRNLRKYLVRKVRNVEENRPFMLEYRDVSIPDWARCVFTLYADDGMFSSNNTRLHLMRKVIRRVAECSGFRINTKKGVRVMRRGRYVTGYEVSEAPKESLDHGPRVDHKTRDQKFRRPLHHMKVGRLPINEETVHMFNGRLAWLKQSNPNWWRRFAVQFRDLVMDAAHSTDTHEAGQYLADQVERYKHL
jgi:hypothetical protein